MSTLYCPECGYNLTGLGGDRCPECGVGVDLRALAVWIAREPLRFREIVLLLLATPMLIGLAVFVLVILTAIVASLLTYSDSAINLTNAVMAVVSTIGLSVIDGCYLGRRVAGDRRCKTRASLKHRRCWPVWAYISLFSVIEVVLTSTLLAGVFYLMMTTD